jgi:hypothetical protein
VRLRVYQVDFSWESPNWIAKKGRYRVCIVPDAKYPGMWRVEHPDSGRMSSMVNLPRAKDAALGLIESLEFTSA